MGGAVWLASAQAGAADTWTTPFTGVRHLYRTASGPLRIHALVVDLCAPGVGVRATASSERKRTTSSFGTNVGAEAAINGDFFSYSTYGTTGLSIGNGTRWTDTNDSNWSGMVAFGPGKAVFSAPSEVVSSPPAWMQQVVSGHPQIVSNGTAITSYDCSGHFCQRHPRTAVGFSKNRRTLYMVVVDGRSSASVGVTLAQLADIMVSVGAYDALNFDGGGSTTMWLRGDGVVNTPSDGSQRTVANHLAIQADGSGMPMACAEDPEESVFLDDGSTTTDINGDGLADVCARAAAGFRCHLSGAGTRIDGPELSNESGWDDPSNYGPLRMADLDGDGRADLCARANAGLVCWRSNGAGFGEAISGPAWSDAAGWNNIKYYSTIRFADINGDGGDDVCGRGPDGIECYVSTPTGFGPRITGPTLSDDSGWGGIDHYGTIRFGDVNGDGKADVCARAAAGMRCWLSDGAGFPSRIDGPVWSDAEGWDQVRFWSTIQLADIDGDGRADLCGRDSSGFGCHLSQGSSFGPRIAGPELSDASGWGDRTNYMTFRMGDVTGDGRADLCARANAGVRCWPSNGAGFGASFVGPELSDAAGWWQPKYFATMRLADVDGDGRADLCARSSERMLCWLSDGAGFATQVDGPQFADSVGWGGQQYWSTIRVAGPKPPPPSPEPDAGVPDAATDDGQAPDADSPDAGVPDAAEHDAADSGAWDAEPVDGSVEPDAAEQGDAQPSDAQAHHDAASARDGGGRDASWSGSGVEPEAGEESGCSCRQAQGGSSGRWLAALALAGALIGVRRRRATNTR